jgi:hypothetical protein
VRKKKEWYQVMVSDHNGVLSIAVHDSINDVRAFAASCKESGKAVTAIVFVRMIDGVPFGQIIYTG